MQGMAKEWTVFIICIMLSIALPWWWLSDDIPLEIETPNIGFTTVKITKSILPDTLLERPLFNETRTQSSEVEESVVIDQVDVAPPPLPPEPKLVGVAVGKGRAVAIVKGNDGKDINLKIGENIDGWKLVYIAQNSVTFSAAGIQKKIALDYANEALGGPVNELQTVESNIEDNK